MKSRVLTSACSRRPSFPGRREFGGRNTYLRPFRAGMIGFDFLAFGPGIFGTKSRPRSCPIFLTNGRAVGPCCREEVAPPRHPVRHPPLARTEQSLAGGWKRGRIVSTGATMVVDQGRSGTSRTAVAYEK